MTSAMAAVTPKTNHKYLMQGSFSTLNHQYGTSLQGPKHSGNFMKPFQPHLSQKEQILPFHMSPQRTLCEPAVSSPISLCRWHLSVYLSQPRSCEHCGCSDGNSAWALESDVPMFNAWFNHLTPCDLGRVVQLLQTSIFPSVKQASSCPP